MAGGDVDRQLQHQPLSKPSAPVAPTVSTQRPSVPDISSATPVLPAPVPCTFTAGHHFPPPSPRLKISAGPRIPTHRTVTGVFSPAQPCRRRTLPVFFTGPGRRMAGQSFFPGCSAVCTLTTNRSRSSEGELRLCHCEFLAFYGVLCLVFTNSQKPSSNSDVLKYLYTSITQNPKYGPSYRPVWSVNPLRLLLARC